MSWTELHIATSADQAVRLGEELTDFGAKAVTFHDGGDQPLYEPAPTTPRVWEETIVIGLFEKQQMNDTLVHYFETQKNAGRAHAISVKDVQETDWVRLSLETFKPMCFGQRLWICPSWYAPPQPEAVNVILDPGLAFGTGSHATTALCLEWLDQQVNAGQVIDYGCGSGILGIAALKLGATQVYAIDNDPQALLSARNNAEQNKIKTTDFITLFPEEQAIPPADIVIANILAKPLIDLAPQLAALTKMGGYIALSGILANQVQDISNAYRPWYNMQQPVFKGEWALLAGIRANNN